MRVVVMLLALIAVLSWLGYETRARDRALSNVLWAFAVAFAVALGAAFFGYY
ncbi:MAG: hypothetical protein H6982_02260 [Chromatiales bacterium]|nr:hypothetical protein [Chromatiales bacterium]